MHLTYGLKMTCKSADCKVPDFTHIVTAAATARTIIIIIAATQGGRYDKYIALRFLLTDIYATQYTGLQTVPHHKKNLEKL